MSGFMYGKTALKMEKNLRMKYTEGSHPRWAVNNSLDHNLFNISGCLKYEEVLYTRKTFVHFESHEHFLIVFYFAGEIHTQSSF